MEQHSIGHRVVIIFCQKEFPDQFSSKKDLDFLETDSTLPSAFLTFDSHFLQTYLQDPFAKLHWQRRN